MIQNYLRAAVRKSKQPPKPNKEIIDLGVKYSPEFACFPFKIITGIYLKLMEEDVGTLVTSGGHGPCRAGYYGEVHKKILQDLGYDDVEFIVIDSPHDDYKYFYEIVKKIKGNNSWLKVARIIKTVYELTKVLDEIEKEVEVLRAYNDNGDVNRIWMDAQEEFYQIKTTDEVKQIKVKYLNKLAKYQYSIPAESDIYKIGIIGDLSEKHEIPVLTISIDEQTADANVLTRVEAFLDMIREKDYREVM